MASVKATSFIGWGKLQDVMFEAFEAKAHDVVDELIAQAYERFSDGSDPELQKDAVTAYVWFYSWQGLADQRDLIPAQDRQGGKSETFNESQLAVYRTKAAAAKEVLAKYAPELKEAELVFGGPLYGGADIPAAFTRGNSRAD